MQGTMIDIVGAQVVEIEVCRDRVWVNVDGVCRFRVQEAAQIELRDDNGLQCTAPVPVQP